MPKRLNKIGLKGHQGSSNKQSNQSKMAVGSIDKKRLAKAVLLDEKKTACEFAWGDKIDGLEGIDKLHIQDLGDIPLPISLKDAKRLKAVAVQAPYGKGLNTILDPAVRRAWQIDLSKVSFPSIVDDSYFSKTTIPYLTSLAVNHLGLSNATEAVEACFYKMLLYEPGGHFKRHRDSEKENGMFGTMILQVPIKGGHQGGSLVVEHCGKVKRFAFDAKSDQNYFLTAFYADCQHQLEEITHGWRLTLVFNLVWKNRILPSKLAVDVPLLLNALNEIKESLSPWISTDGISAVKPPTAAQAKIVSKAPSVVDVSSDEDDDDSDYETNSEEDGLIFFPLEHKYSKQSLSFYGLKGQDRLLTQLLQSCSFLDVHLAIVVQCISGGYDPDVGHEEVHKRSFEFSHLINSSNMPIELPKLKVDYKSQLVGNSKKFLNPEDPVREEEDQLGNEATTSERWYHQAVLIAWPRNNTSHFYFKFNFDSMLSRLEGQVLSRPCDVLSNKEESIEHLRKLLNFFNFEPRRNSWKQRDNEDSDKALRLLKLCIHLNAKAEGLLLLELVGKEEGIRDEQVSEAIAEFECSVAGWIDCAKIIKKIITADRIRSKPLPIISLVFHLLDRFCIEGAKSVADDICSHLSNSFSSGRGPLLPQELIGAYVKMIVRLEADPKTANPNRIASLTRIVPLLSGEQLGLLIIDFQSCGLSNSTSFKDIRQEFLTQIGLANISDYDIILQILEMSVRQENDSFASLLIEKICSGLLQSKKPESGKTTYSSYKPVEKSKKEKKFHSRYRSDYEDYQEGEELGEEEMGEEEMGEEEMGEEEMDEEEIDEEEIDEEEDEDYGYSSRRGTATPAEVSKLSFLIKLFSSTDLWQVFAASSKNLIRTTSFKVIQQWITEKLATEESELKLTGTETSAQHHSYWYAYGYNGRRVDPPKIEDDPLQGEITSAVKLFIVIEKTHPSAAGQAKKNNQLFSPLMAKMSLRRLASLLITIYQAEHNPSVEPNVKHLPSLLDFCKILGNLFTTRTELREYLKSFGNDTVCNLFLFFCWIEDSQVLFAQKILDVYLQQLDNPLITKMIASPEIRHVITIAPPENREAFLILLDRKISTLNGKLNVAMPAFTWKQPNASFPSCPIVEAFLHSPNETMTRSDFGGINEARKFSQRLLQGQSFGKYSVSVVEKGVGKNAKCEITKTKAIFQQSIPQTDKFSKELFEMNQLRLEIQQLKVVETSGAGPSKPTKKKAGNPSTGAITANKKARKD